MQNHVKLCLGIDPNPKEYSFEKFQIAVENHRMAIESVRPLLKEKILKLNLAFFLSYGSKGISLLEEFIEKFRDDFSIILDGKFNEISNSLKAYLDFVFKHLKVNALTLNPFLGENTLRLAFETCAAHAGEKGRVYVLCVTSEGSTSTLAYLQENWRNKLMACAQIRDEVFGKDGSLAKSAGVVIGANKTEILFSRELKDSRLSVLSPGLGFQGGDLDILKHCEGFSNEFTFPMSRSLFEAGSLTPAQVAKNLISIQKFFGGNYDKN